MSSHGTFSLQLVNQVIDELGKGYRKDSAMFPNFARKGKDYATLCTCSLVSKRWSSRSRMHIFKTVRIHGDKDQPTIAPPPSILPYVKDLEIHYDYGSQKSTKGNPLEGFLKAFATSPIEYLKITSGALADQRTCIREFIDVNSTTLRTVKFNLCSFSPHNISDIVLEPHRIQSLHLVDAGEWAPSRGNLSPAVDEQTPGSCPKLSEVELCISGGDPLEGPVGIAMMVAHLPCQFRKLDVEHVAAGEGAPEATNALLKANAAALSSLRVRICAGMCGKFGSGTFLTVV